MEIPGPSAAPLVQKGWVWEACVVYGKCLNLSGSYSLTYKAGDMRSGLQSEGSGALSS